MPRTWNSLALTQLVLSLDGIVCGSHILVNSFETLYFLVRSIFLTLWSEVACARISAVVEVYESEIAEITWFC